MPERRPTVPLPSSPFRFEMGLRRGARTYFANTDADTALLAERAHWLATEPDRYLAATEGAQSLIADAHRFFLATDSAQQANASLAALGRAWAPDFLLLAPGADGTLLLQAGCVCFPSHWDLREKIGRPLREIHEPVPTLNTTLGRQIDTFFAALKPGTVWERWNWGLAATAERNAHPERQLPRITPETPLDRIWLRAEHQALVRLEGTGTLLFGIRIHLEPLTETLRPGGAAERLADLLATMPEEVARYKGVGLARGALIARLRGTSNAQHPTSNIQ